MQVEDKGHLPGGSRAAGTRCEVGSQPEASQERELESIERAECRGAPGGSRHGGFTQGAEIATRRETEYGVDFVADFEAGAEAVVRTSPAVRDQTNAPLGAPEQAD